MTDHLQPDLIERELEARFRIPTEVWTDVFKLLSRRVLVQNISPVCYRFKEICNKNVKNIHVIENAIEFYRKLKEDDPEAKKELEHLAGNKCLLAGQFRLTFLSKRDEKSQIIAIRRYCPDLFNGCKIELRSFWKNKGSTIFLEYLGHLEMAKPVQITVDQHVDQIIDFWHHPTFRNCARVHLKFWPSVSAPTLMAETVNIFDWLHRHQPTDGMDSDGSSAEEDCGDGSAADQQVVRCMIATFYFAGPAHIDWLLDRCSHDLQQAHGPADRRPYVFSFKFGSWFGSRVNNNIVNWLDQFRRAENKSTGEVLVLDRVMRAEGLSPIYRLRRCLAEEEANGKELYAGMFKRAGCYEAFSIDESAEKTPEVIIQ